jgi:site-specific DNA-methyltransferase (adenine-specific)
MDNKRGTKTSSFGSSGREGHDSSYFYSSRMYQEYIEEDNSSPYIENPISSEYLDTLIQTSSTDMHQLPDSCVHLMVTSPPYNVRKDYDEDLTLTEYLTILRSVFQETYRVLVPGGRACINIANLGRKPYIPLNGYVSQIMTETGFLMRGEIIWDKAASSGSSTAWGSWKSASNPTLRDVHEYILVFSKMRFNRDKVERDSTINRDEFLEYSKSIWSFQTESAKNVGHPAPFPEELPYRLIQLYTFEDEVVLDPFIGSGTTAVACIKTNRHFVGYDIDEGYLKIAKKRVKEARNIQLKLF